MFPMLWKPELPYQYYSTSLPPIRLPEETAEDGIYLRKSIITNVKSKIIVALSVHLFHIPKVRSKSRHSWSQVDRFCSTKSKSLSLLLNLSSNPRLKNLDSTICIPSNLI